MATVRYLVNDVGSSVKFYTELLGFKLEQQFGPNMAILSQGESGESGSGLNLWLAGPNSSAAQPMPNGEKPSPGGWNRFVFEVPDLPELVLKLKSAGVKFKNEIIAGPGGSQILCEDPSGNVIELFQGR